MRAKLIIIITWEEFDEGEAKPQRISAGYWPCCHGIRNGRYYYLRRRLCLGALYHRNRRTTAETLLVVARQLFPHDRLGDQYYAVMVDSLDKQAAGDPALRKLLADGVGRLDSARGIAWVQLSNGARDAVLKSMEGSEFFATIRAATINNLYTNPLVYRFFGFEGSSVEHGGYIRRGFDDIGWLPSS
jgi:hypothetical protein